MSQLTVIVQHVCGPHTHGITQAVACLDRTANAQVASVRGTIAVQLWVRIECVHRQTAQFDCSTPCDKTSTQFDIRAPRNKPNTAITCSRWQRLSGRRLCRTPAVVHSLLKPNPCSPGHLVRTPLRAAPDWTFMCIAALLSGNSASPGNPESSKATPSSVGSLCQSHVFNPDQESWSGKTI
jgi:hypothetical protein